MFELSTVFESQATTSAFLIIVIGFIIFNVLFDTSLVLIRNPCLLRSMPRATQIQIVGALVLAAVFFVAGVDAGATPLSSHRKTAAVAAPADTFSIERRHGHIDMKALPSRTIKNPI